MKASLNYIMRHHLKTKTTTKGWPLFNGHYDIVKGIVVKELQLIHKRSEEKGKEEKHNSKCWMNIILEGRGFILTVC